MSSTSSTTSYYPYDPSHVLPIVFAVLIGTSWLLHTYQNLLVPRLLFNHDAKILTSTSRYHYWKVTFFMFWGGAVFMSGWIIRAISSHYPANLPLYISQTVLVLAGPPIYSAAEYNILSRLMNYLPMHAPLNPNRVVILFIYLGATVEGLTAAGATLMASAKDKKFLFQRGSALVAASLVLQAVVEIVFMGLVGLIHYRCTKSNMATRSVRTICIMLYGTSTLVFLRCIFRAIEAISQLSILSSSTCDGTCNEILRHEWYLYAFEATPMVLYTLWLNLVHPGRFLPQKPNVFLDGTKMERVGPGCIDRRSKWVTFVDPFDVNDKGREKFWLRPGDFSVVDPGVFISDIQAGKPRVSIL